MKPYGEPDEKARGEDDAELRRYREALRAIDAGDRAAFHEESKRHAQRMGRIVSEHARRNPPPRPAE